MRFGLRGGDGDVAASEQIVGQSARELGPVLAAVGALVDAAFLRAADDGPRLALAVPHAGEDHLRIAGLQFEIGRAARIGNKQNVLPGLAAVRRC